MKKFTVALLAVIVSIGVVATSFAAETTFSGAYRVRAWTEWNFDKEVEDFGVVPSHEDGLYTGFIDQRFRLTITHTRSEYLKAVVRIDIAEDTWGTGSALRINDSNADYIDHAYLEFTVPPVGTFTVGRFPESYGYGTVFSNDGWDGARWANAWGPVAVSLSYFKVADNVTAGSADEAYNWDADLVAMNLGISPIEGHLLEVFGGVLWDDDASGDGGVWGVLGNSATWTAAGFNNPGYYDAVVGFVGVAYTGNIMDMIDIAAEASWIIGSADSHWYRGGLVADPYAAALGPNAAPRSLDISGWNIYADVSYYNDLFRVGAAFIMGSGQEHDWNDVSWEHVNMNFISVDAFEFGRIIAGSAGGNQSIWGDPWSANNLENITAIKGYFEVCPMDKLTVSGAVIWAKWTEDIGQNNATRAALFAPDSPGYPHPVAWYSGNYTYNSWEVSNDLGWEIDLSVSYEIMEGLTYSLAGGVLFTGDSWDYEKADGTRGDWGEIWSIVNTLEYEF
ncbi:MAG: hypothetical protein JW885_13980 [Deltaproteobacteria bacterium]|nr:hypothetical protein [Candidatus Zymogenaceae bacterium]